MASISDASGIHTISYALDGRALTDAIQFQNEMHTLYESYDAFGRSSGYALSNNVNGASSLVTKMTQSNDAFGRIVAVAVSDIPSPFRYGYIPGSDLQQSLAMPNGVTRQTTYDSHRDSLMSITHTNAAGVVLTRRNFSHNAIGRLMGRTQYRLGDATSRLDTFDYNARSELTQAVLGTNDYFYVFDPSGNRERSIENAVTNLYVANDLNQYTNILFQSVSSVDNFFCAFDADGNQTVIRTSSGVWHVRYNGENRPVCFSNDTAVVDMGYDYRGRRYFYQETVNGIITRRERYIYRGYLPRARPASATPEVLKTATR